MCSSAPKYTPPPLPTELVKPPPPPRFAGKSDLTVDANGKTILGPAKTTGRSDLVVDLVPKQGAGAGLRIPTK